MKIYEIISESNSHLDEGSFGSYLLGKYGPKLLGAGEKTAAKEVPMIIKKLNIGLDTFLDMVKKMGGISILVPTITTYVDEIKQGISQVEAGNWDDTKFQTYRRQRTTIFITKLTSEISLYWLAGKTIPIATGAASSIGNVLTFGLLKYLLPMLAKITNTTAQLYFMNLINTPEGANALATLIASPVINDIYGTAVTGAIDYLSKKADQAIGVSIPGASTKNTPDNNFIQPTQPDKKGPPIVVGASSRIIDW